MKTIIQYAKKCLSYFLANKTKVVKAIGGVVIIVTEVIALFHGTSIGVETLKIMGVM